MMPIKSAIMTCGIRIAIVWFTHIPVVVVVGVVVVGVAVSEKRHYNIYDMYVTVLQPEC
jgi:hypothetical protein